MVHVETVVGSSAEITTIRQMRIVPTGAVSVRMDTWTY